MDDEWRSGQTVFVPWSICHGLHKCICVAPSRHATHAWDVECPGQQASQFDGPLNHRFSCIADCYYDT